jgi:hypothetical protein
MTNQPLPFHGLTTPAPFVFDDQSKVLYVRLQYGSLLPYEIQEWDIPFIPIDLSRIIYCPDEGAGLDNMEIIYCPDEGAGLDNMEIAFRDDWLLGHLLPRVLLGMYSFFESHGLDWSPSDEIRELLRSEDCTCSKRATLELLSFYFPHDPTVQFNMRRLKAAVTQFICDGSGVMKFYVFIHFNGELACILCDSLQNVVLSTNGRCINDLYAGQFVESAVEEMSAVMDANIADSRKTLFSDVKTSVKPKQQHAPTSILKRGMKTDVGNVVMPPAGLPSEMVSDEKHFQRPPNAQHGHPASGLSSTADANLDVSSDDEKMTQNSHKAKGGIHLGLYDCLDDASDEFERLVAALWMMMGFLLRWRLPRSRQTDRMTAPMHVFHHKTPGIDHRIMCLQATDITTIPLWVVLASTIVAPIRPVAVKVLVAVCHHVGVAPASSAALRVAWTLPGITLVTRTSSLTASLSVR